MGKTASKKKHEPPPSSNETQTTTSTYLSTHLIVPYFITANGTIKRPEHLIAWWSRIFSFYVPDDKDRIELRYLCRLFRDALKPPPLHTTFPHPNYWALNKLVDKLNNVYKEDPNKAPKIVFVAQGTFQNNTNGKVYIDYPMKIIGAGQNKTILSSYAFYIGGKKEKGQRVVLQHLTLANGFSQNVLYNNNGLSFLCYRMTITKGHTNGVYVYNARGRFRNCVITECGGSGILCYENALVELEGNQTKVERNGTRGGGFGLCTYFSSSRIHLLFPLTKESVSTNNGGNGNYGGIMGGSIETVDSF
jgi:hypothetical protein